MLTGILTGLLAQKVDPSDAALLGMWLHGRAGDLAMEPGRRIWSSGKASAGVSARCYEESISPDR